MNDEQLIIYYAKIVKNIAISPFSCTMIWFSMRKKMAICMAILCFSVDNGVI